jgi:beta-glucosidase
MTAVEKGQSSMTFQRAAFPHDFWWGTATAAYQVEGAVAEGGRSPSIWDTFAHTPGATHLGSTGDVAADHYHRVAEDVAMMRDLGVNAYRFSIAWSRLLPGGVGLPNPEGVAFYRDLCERLREAGVTPMATLYHWDLPQVLEDQGGWLNPRSPEWFAEYADVAKTQLGDLVTTWSTLNEPWCSAFLGYAAGQHAPGRTAPADGLVAAHHLLVAHHRALRAMRSARRQPEDRLGIVLNLIPAWPATDSPADHAAADAIDLVHNRLFADAVFHGRYPAAVLALHNRYEVGDLIDPGELETAREPIDYLGVNYYNVNRVAYVEGAPAPGPWPGADGASIVRPPGRLTEMGWGVEPDGLVWTLARVATEYPPTPIYICENGAAYPDEIGPDGEVDDPDRIAYLEGHIAAVAAAIEQGVDVRGYFVWSLMDNFEWARGYEKRFGLVHIDRTTMARTLKASGRWYRDFLSSTPVP